MSKIKNEGIDLSKIVLVGNPNVGKSVIFGKLTGKYATVSNYPGTTVDISQGIGIIGGKEFFIIDTPGINNLIPRSEDERVARDVLFKNNPYNVILVADGKNLSRALIMALQILEMGFPVVLALNMADEAKERGIIVNTRQLSANLGINIIETTAVTGEGISALKKTLYEQHKPSYKFDYGLIVENAINEISALLPDNLTVTKRSASVMILSGDETLFELIKIDAETIQKINSIIQLTQSKLNQPLNIFILVVQQKNVENLLKDIISTKGQIETSISEKISKITLHPVAGTIIFLLVLYLIFKLVGDFGAGTLVDFMENKIFAEYVNPVLIGFIKKNISNDFFQSLLIGKYGLITMALTYAIAIVLPIMVTFFLAFGFLEDSGYLPRLTVMADRIFRVIGLTGKAVLPFVLGLGCGTMACMTTRILESKKERIIATLLIALGIPCSAQLGVMLGISSQISTKATLLIIVTIIFQIFLVGFISSKIISGERSLFLIELPPIRFPQIKNIIIKTYTRSKWFFIEAVPLFMLGTLFLFIADWTGLLSFLEKSGEPLMTGVLGLPQETISVFILGFLRRDYGAAGLYQMAQKGMLNPTQIVVSLTVITLFVPCISSFFIMIKEHGLKIGMAIMGFISIYAFFIGGILNYILHSLNIVL
ncbi:ferrous iron transport protein B [Candidatus Poribacteria bacterium]|nr:ferrous iron transport protein B [Candidatus Poribacteria bacterium]